MRKKMSLSVLIIFFIGCSTPGEIKRNALKASFRLENGNTFFSKGQLAEAISEYEAALGFDSSNPLIHNNLGLVYFARERSDLALKHMHQALILNSNYTEARNNRGKIYMQLQQLDKAEQDFLVSEQDLKYTRADETYSYLALIYFKRGQFEKSEIFSNKAIKFDEKNCLGRSILGRISYEKKKFTEAVKILDKATEVCKPLGFEEPEYFSALSYFHIGEKDKSIAILEHLTIQYPNGSYFKQIEEILNIIKR
jgi:type IV pilus assembly protein PilF